MMARSNGGRRNSWSASRKSSVATTLPPGRAQRDRGAHLQRYLVVLKCLKLEISFAPQLRLSPSKAIRLPPTRW
jgi:hypothetical protein